MRSFTKRAELPRVEGQAPSGLRLAATIRENRNLSVSRVEVDRLEGYLYFVMLKLNILNFCQFVTTLAGGKTASDLSLRLLLLYRSSDYRIPSRGSLT